tara:strand:- start:610 stop:957 length:348 start_codon:yes stop_codon:yes gene_type:complete
MATRLMLQLFHQSRLTDILEMLGQFLVKVIAEDMTKAKEIFKAKIREVRKPLLEAEDVVYMKAMEADDSSAKTASVNKKKALRDAPAAKAITDADTIAKLKAAWDTSVLGDSPYA